MSAPTEHSQVKVWDPAVRILHWGIVLGFLVAYLTEDEFLSLHVWAGYLVAALVALRLVWGFVGPKHARFADFVYAPPKVAKYLAELVEFRARRYLGHSPGGGAMIVVLFAALALGVVSGVWVYAVSFERGPLASFAHPNADSDSGSAQAESNGQMREESSLPWDEVHEAIVNLTVLLVIVHVLAVLLVSMLHKENLVRAMITGMKRAPDQQAETIRDSPDK